MPIKNGKIKQLKLIMIELKLEQLLKVECHFPCHKHYYDFKSKEYYGKLLFNDMICYRGRFEIELLGDYLAKITLLDNLYIPYEIFNIIFNCQDNIQLKIKNKYLEVYAYISYKPSYLKRFIEVDGLEFIVKDIFKDKIKV